MEGTMSLITLQQYISRTFSPGSEPHQHTVRRWINRKIIPGKRFGTRYYVDEIAVAANGNPIVEKVLRDASAA